MNTPAKKSGGVGIAIISALANVTLIVLVWLVYLKSPWLILDQIPGGAGLHTWMISLPVPSDLRETLIAFTLFAAWANYKSAESIEEGEWFKRWVVDAAPSFLLWLFTLGASFMVAVAIIRS